MSAQTKKKLAIFRNKKKTKITAEKQKKRNAKKKQENVGNVVTMHG